MKQLIITTIALTLLLTASAVAQQGTVYDGPYDAIATDIAGPAPDSSFTAEMCQHSIQRFNAPDSPNLSSVVRVYERCLRRWDDNGTAQAIQRDRVIVGFELASDGTVDHFLLLISEYAGDPTAQSPSSCKRWELDNLAALQQTETAGEAYTLTKEGTLALASDTCPSSSP